jgi:hypothetical protein
LGDVAECLLGSEGEFIHCVVLLWCNAHLLH